MLFRSNDTATTEIYTLSLHDALPIFEETPSAVVSPRRRERLGETAVRGLRAIGYRNAGTVEFLYHDGGLTFNEVNARLQVEHPITEIVTGVDLVRQQILVAAGEDLEISQA